MEEFSPHLEVLPAAQRRFWNELSAVPREFVLYGGTALALHLGHRNSVDFDFFGRDALNLSGLETTIMFLDEAKIIQREENTLTALVNRDGYIKVSFFGVPRLPRPASPHVAGDNCLQVASLLDLARRIIWFEPPERALAEPVRFLAYAMTYALHEDMREIRRHFADDDFREALDQAPPGIIDARSWAYWNSKLDRYPPPPRQVRRFADAEGARLRGTTGSRSTPRGDQS